MSTSSKRKSKLITNNINEIRKRLKSLKIYIKKFYHISFLHYFCVHQSLQRPHLDLIFATEFVIAVATVAWSIISGLN
jgi:hypothetical protein